MKKLLLLCMCFIGLMGCQSTVELNEYVTDHQVLDNSLNHYKIIASLDEDTRIISCDQTIIYTNDDDITHDSIFLHVYPNVFSEENQPNLNTGDKTSNKHSGLDISEIFVNGEKVDFRAGEHDTVVEILNTFDTEQVYEIQMNYKLKVSYTSDRFGYRNGVYHLCNWYPILAVYDEDGWNLDPYLFIGDPFYSEMSTYDVVIEVPHDYVVSGSGSIVSLERDEQALYRFEANRMRDFALVMSDDFMLESQQVNDTLVQLYYLKEDKNNESLNKALEYGVKSIETFEEVIGDYPYNQYSVVLTEFDSGMEYPGLVLISNNYLKYSESSLKEVIIHETVHQWFYGIIGGDEIDEGWIDEGLTTYFTTYYDLFNGDKALYNKEISNYQSRVDNIGFEEIVVSDTSYDFDNWGTYSLAAYVKPALLYHRLYETYGEEKIHELAQTLYQKYAYKILKVEDLRETLIEVYSDDIEELLNEWWY